MGVSDLIGQTNDRGPAGRHHSNRKGSGQRKNDDGQPLASWFLDRQESIFMKMRWNLLLMVCAPAC